MLTHRLSLSLDRIRRILREEIAVATDHIFGHHLEWTTRKVGTDFSALAARVTARVLVGTPLCYSQQWLHATENYTRLSFAAASELRRTHWLWRPVRHWFMRSCIDLRKTAETVRKLILTELGRRRSMDDEVCLRLPLKPPEDTPDALFLDTTRYPDRPGIKLTDGSIRRHFPH
jgi:hypothetical protein